MKTYKAANAKIYIDGKPLDDVTDFTYKPDFESPPMTNASTLEGWGSASGSLSTPLADMQRIADRIRWHSWIGRWVEFWSALADQLEAEEIDLLTRGNDDPWLVLGIPLTADERTIKRAYAAAIRRHPPERDAAAFQRVRMAYESAMRKTNS